MRSLEKAISNLLESVSNGFLSVKEDVDSMRTEIGNDLVHKGEGLVKMGAQILHKGGNNDRSVRPAFPIAQDQHHSISVERVNKTNQTYACTAPYTMKRKHNSLSDMWDEWHGNGEFSDSDGGVLGRIEKYGSKSMERNGEAIHRLMLAVLTSLAQPGLYSHAEVNSGGK